MEDSEAALSSKPSQEDTKLKPQENLNLETEKHDGEGLQTVQQQQEPLPSTAWEPPDGGTQAWLCVAGCAACYFCSFGWINAVGVFQEYYQLVPLRNYSPTTVSWITSTESFFLPFCGPLVGNLFDNYGPIWLLITGTILHVFGLMMASLGHKYYQFLLAQGVCSSIGTSFIFNPALVCVLMWFTKRRGLAVALAAAGASIGGVIFPIIVDRLVPRVGFPWAMRTCAFLVLGLMLFAIATVRTPTKPAPRPFTKEIAHRMLQPAYLLLGLSFFLMSLGFFLPIAYMSEVAFSNGMSLSLGQYLVSIYNAGAFIGRLLPGIIGKQLGFFNLNILAAGTTSILTLALWIPAKSNAAFICFSIFFGVSSNCVIAILPILIGAISQPKEIGLRGGACYGVSSVAALAGIPIGSALIKGTNYEHMQIFSGVLMLAATACTVLVRIAVGGVKPWKAV